MDAKQYAKILMTLFYRKGHLNLIMVLQVLYQ